MLRPLSLRENEITPFRFGFLTEPSVGWSVTATQPTSFASKTAAGKITSQPMREFHGWRLKQNSAALSSAAPDWLRGCRNCFLPPLISLFATLQSINITNIPPPALPKPPLPPRCATLLFLYQLWSAGLIKKPKADRCWRPKPAI